MDVRWYEGHVRCEPSLLVDIVPIHAAGDAKHDVDVLESGHAYVHLVTPLTRYYRCVEAQQMRLLYLESFLSSYPPICPNDSQASHISEEADSTLPTAGCQICYS